MTHTLFASSTANVPDDSAVGSLSNGLLAPYSVGPNYFPVGYGDVLHPADDLASFARWVISGSEIGRSALTPEYEISSVDSIGLAWVTIDDDGRRVGLARRRSVPGFSSILGFDLARRRAVASARHRRLGRPPWNQKLPRPSSTCPLSRARPGRVPAIAALACVLAVGCCQVAARLGRRLVSFAVTCAAQTGWSSP